MKADKQNESVRRQAQDLAYKAMESYDFREAVRLSTKAIELDPRCVDALTILAGTIDDPDERAHRLSEVIQIAEENLGGKRYFEENKGYFWGMVETRPYMRARESYAQALYLADDINAAIAEYEEMLELNPGDNQGNRYPLMALYLEIDDLAGASHLRDEYGDEGTTVFTWLSVLECLIEGDYSGAEWQLAEARKANPFFEDYLRGKKSMPREMPDYYSLGDENEAIMCMDTIGQAWKKHPAAMDWLRKHETQAQGSPKVKVGRNDPCPCGSGKKYKKCCIDQAQAPSVKTATGGMIAAEMELSDLQQAMQEREFSSIEEMDAFIQDYDQKQNRTPLDDFEGLSPEQMYKLQNLTFESPEIVEFPTVLDNPPSAPVVTLFEILVEAIGEDGLKPTSTGNLPRKLVQDAAMACWGEERYRKHTQYASIRSETDFYELYFTRLIAELAGLIRKYKGKFILSRECRKLLKQGGMRVVYPILLRVHAQEFNWAYWDNFPETSYIQELFGYTLYLLDRYGDQWRENTFYEDAFMRAFPLAMKHVEAPLAELIEMTNRGMYTQRCLRRFCEFTGLVESDRKPDELFMGVYKLRKTPLFDDAVRFIK